MTMVVDVGGAGGIVPCRNITVRTGGCGIAGGIVPRLNIVFRNVIFTYGSDQLRGVTVLGVCASAGVSASNRSRICFWETVEGDNLP